MNAKVFIDTNILIYAVLYTPLDRKKRIASIDLLKNTDIEFIVSTQVFNECYNVLLRNGLEDRKIQLIIEEIMLSATVSPVSEKTIRLSWEIRNQYGYSIWDSLIIASAVENHCSILYSEDLQNRQRIGQSLEIINPL